MKLESVMVRHFRSLEDVELKDCADFNVLIGKNNAGKSNVLSAIDAFFESIASTEVVSLDPPFTQDIDFYNRMQIPLDMALSFSIEPAERAVLLEDLALEAPQMKNALSDLGSDLQLCATVTINPPPGSLGFVSNLTLSERTQAAKSFQLLAIQSEAAAEISDALKQERQSQLIANQIRRVLNRVSPVDFAEAREAPDAARLLFRNFPPGSGARTVYPRLVPIIRASATFEDFKSGVEELITSLIEDGSASRLKPLKHQISTFSGEQSSVPEYVRKLLRRMAAIRVVYLRERRDEIGKTEATRLLNLKNQRGGTRHFKRIQEAVKSLLGVDIEVFQGDSATASGETEAEIDVDDFLAQVNGSGVREALRIILDVEFQNPSILLVEEPEVYLHPSLETSMMRYLVLAAFAEMTPLRDPNDATVTFGCPQSMITGRWTRSESFFSG